MRTFFLLFILSVSSFAYSQNQLKVVDFNGLKPYLETNSDTVFVVNFWATWCKPCVVEMPYFLELEKKLQDEKFKLILVSLDFKEQLNSRLIPFLTKKNMLGSTNFMLDDPDANYWIDQVDTSWSGAIPATIFFSKNYRKFYEKSFTMDELLDAYYLTKNKKL